MRLCLEDLPSPLLPWLRDQQLAELSKSLQALQPSIKAIHWTIGETQAISESTTSFPHSHPPVLSGSGR